jgi:HD-like signal output (HDOD) protein/ActR/RegA family two-component response regulator
MIILVLKRLLFVDDEPLIRELYGTLGSTLGKGHEVHTAASAGEALDLLDEKNFDVVVSDLAMPEMDGIEFLSEVVRGYPQSARIVISGFADRLKVAECLTVGHRFFTKPFNLNGLSVLLRRICQYSYLVSNDRVRKMVCGTGALPTPPETYVRLRELVASPYAHIDDISAIVEEDPGLSTKLLHIVNSAQFGIGRQIVAPSEAVQIAGIEIIKALILSGQVFGFYERQNFNRGAFKDLWAHSVNTAIAARKLAILEGLPTDAAEECFFAGLLHDIGKLILAANAEREYSVAMELAAKASLPIEQAEMGLFSSTHAHVGAYLLALWGVPDSVITAVELHHTLDGNRISGFDTAVAVHVAQNLEPGGARKKLLNTSLLEKLGVMDRLPVWEEAIAAPN